MAKKAKYYLHRITREDADYINEETYTRSMEVENGYLLVDTKKDKPYLEDNKIFVYRPNFHHTGNEELDKFLEAIEACAFFRGYCNQRDIRFKTEKIPQLLYELEDHSIEIPDNVDNQCKIIRPNENVYLNREITDYMNQASESFSLFLDLQRKLPGLALFINDEMTIDFNQSSADNEIDEDGYDEDDEEYDEDDEYEDEEEEEYDIYDAY